MTKADGSIRYCENCGRPFPFTTANRRFCCDRCAHNLAKRKRRAQKRAEMTVIKICSYAPCGQSFATHGTKKYCCARCEKRQRAEERRLHPVDQSNPYYTACRHCGRTMLSVHNLKYCDPTCRDAAAYQRNNKAKREYARKRTELVNFAKQILKRTGEKML